MIVVQGSNVQPRILESQVSRKHEIYSVRLCEYIGKCKTGSIRSYEYIIQGADRNSAAAMKMSSLRLLRSKLPLFFIESRI